MGGLWPTISGRSIACLRAMLFAPRAIIAEEETRRSGAANHMT
jgi:hypothetical protein